MTTIIDWGKALHHANNDLSVGIQIATLTESEGKGTFITVIPPGSSVNAHYHTVGDEEYHIISGKGVIRLRPVDSTDEWICKNVVAQNSFTIPANVIHQLVNNGEEPLTLLFSCPFSHLNDDRFIYKN